MRRTLTILTVAALLVVAAAARAHITPPVVLQSDRDALVGLLSGARKFFVREVRLTGEERDALRAGAKWSPDEEFHRFYLGRDEQGGLVAAALFLTEFTIHGPVRVAVGLTPDGKVKGASVVELSEETYPWLKPLLDQDFTREFVGQGSRGGFALGERVTRVGGDMTQLYAKIVGNLVRRGAVLYEVAVLKRGGA